METVTDTDGNRYKVCAVIPMPGNYVQVNLCRSDSRVVQPERGISMAPWLAQAWIAGTVRVKVP